jgi:nitronate monooxygenase
MVVHRTYPRLAAELELVQEFRPPVVVTALGSPRGVIDAVHAYGGLVFADVVNVGFARKAAEAGVDGLVLVGAGAGGHTGPLSGFAFVAEVRAFWDGPIALAGAISDGRAVRAAEVLGADLAYMGTRFIAARESLAADAYRAMLVGAGAEDIVLTDAVTGVPANFLLPSLVENGWDPARLAPTGGRKIDFGGDPQDERKAWKHLWAAGQGVGATTRVEGVAEIAARLGAEYAAAVADGRGPNIWTDRADKRQAAA